MHSRVGYAASEEVQRDDSIESSTAAILAEDGVLGEMAATVSALEGRLGRTLRAGTLHGRVMDFRSGFDFSEVEEQERSLPALRTTGVAHRHAEVHSIQPDAQLCAEG